MAAHQVVLKVAQALGRDLDFAESAEAGGHTVADLALGDDPLDHGAGVGDPFDRVGRQGDRLLGARNGHHVADRQRLAGQQEGGGHR
jgi:hypothetical protein